MIIMCTPLLTLVVTYRHEDFWILPQDFEHAFSSFSFIWLGKSVFAILRKWVKERMRRDNGGATFKVNMEVERTKMQKG